MFTYNLPLTAVFALFILINVIALPLLRVNLAGVYPLWMIVPTVVFFVAPMLNDVFFWTFRLNIFRLMFYFISVFILYGSMFFSTFASSLFGLFGKKANFIVTPKKSGRITFLQAVALQYKEILFSTALIALAAACSYFGSGGLLQGVFAVILMAVTGYFSVMLPLFSNVRYDTREVAQSDAHTVGRTLAQNGLVKRIVAESLR